MPQAVEVVAEVVVPEDADAVAAAAAAEAAEAAEFEAGFTNTPTAVVPPVEEVFVVDPEAVVVPEVKYRQITETEYAELSALSTQIETIRADQRKELDKAFGKVGGVERTLAAMQAATPTGYTVEVTDDIVADLQKEFPELGVLTLKALKLFAGKLKGTAPVIAAAPTLDPKQIEAAVTQRLVELQIEALEDDRPTWREIVGDVSDTTNAYRIWLAKQPAAYQTKLGATNSAQVIGRSITQFETDTAKAAATSPAAIAAAKAAAATAAATARQKRLDAATTPRGAGGHAPTSTVDEFVAGFESG